MKLGFRFLFAVVFLSIFSCKEYKSNQSADLLDEKETLSASEEGELARLLSAGKIHLIDSLMERAHSYYRFNGNLLVSYKGNVIYSKAFGYADFSEKENLTEESVYQLASVSKQFTAMSIMMLKEEGKLSFTDDVRKYIPELPYEGITIQNLLNHTGGLPNYMWLLEHHWNNERPPNNEEIIDMMAKHKLNLYFWPGRRFDYSNTGYMLLASVVERISEQKFETYVKQNIFEPLDMDHSFVYSAAYGSDKEKLKGYYPYGRYYREISETVNDGAVGDKGVYSTAGDLAKWDEALYQHKLISQELQQEAFTPGKVRNRYEIPYGYGFRIKEKDDKKLVYHNGVWNGFRTGIHRYVEDSFTVIILNNTSCRAKNVIAQRVASILHEDNHGIEATHLVVNTAINNGVEGAITALTELKTDAGVVDDRKLTEVADFMRDINKPQLSLRIKQLQKEIEAINGNQGPVRTASLRGTKVSDQANS